MSEDRDKIIGRVEKLIRKAERAGTPEEAEAFFAKAHSLMARWSIEEAMLNFDDESHLTIVSDERIEVPKSGFWKDNCHLIHLLSLASDVKAIRIDVPAYSKAQRDSIRSRIPEWEPPKPYMSLVGTKQDCDHVKFLYASMRIQIVRAGNDAIPRELKGQARESFLWRRSFLIGFSNRIYQRLMAVRREAKETVEREDRDGHMALALVGKGELVQKAFELAHPDERKVSVGNRLVSPEAIKAGRDAADRTDLGKGKVGTTTRGELN